MLDFNDRDAVISKLQELKAKNLPHMTIEQFSKIDSSFARDIKQATEEELQVICEKLKPFYRAEEGANTCIFTDSTPSLTWGLTHGIAVDNNTGLSWRHYHYFTIGGKERRYEITLQYHPSNYEIEEGA